MKRIQAFTLFEVLISLLLVVILGTLAVLTLGGPLRNLTDAGGISQQRSAILLASERMQVDLDEASIITAAGNGTLVFEGGGGSVRYEQRSDTLVRIGSDGESPQLLLRSMGTTEMRGAPGLIAIWSVQVDDPAEAGPLIFRKDYDARTLLRYLIDHGHTGTDLP